MSKKDRLKDITYDEKGKPYIGCKGGVRPLGIHDDPTNDNYCDGPQGPYDPNYNKGGINVAWIVIGLGFIALMAYFSISGGGA